MPSPIGIRVPVLGSCCSKCEYQAPAPNGDRCQNPDYIRSSYRWKKAGDDRFVDGKTGQVIANPDAFCCNYFDWAAP